MLRPDGLDEDEMDAYHRGLSFTHRRRIEVEITTLDGRTVAHLTPEVTGGQVLVDAEAGDDVTSRILEIEFVQRRHMLFEPESSSDMPFHRKYAIRVVDARYIAELERWVECPLFYGPIWDVRRIGATVRVVGHGWERQAYSVKWNPDTYKKGKSKTDIIKELLTEVGFTQLGGIPDLPATLPEPMTMTKADLIWPACRKLARSMDRHLYFNADGRPRLRQIPDSLAFIFDERHLMAEPEVGREARTTPNVFQVIGARPEGAKRRVRDVRELDPEHPDSKEELALNEQPYRVLLSERNDAIKTQAEAEARAKRLRDQSERGNTDTQVDVLPFPHFEEMDLAAVRGHVGAERIRLKRFTVPFSLQASPLSINSLRKAGDRGRGRRGRDMGRGAA